MLSIILAAALAVGPTHPAPAHFEFTVTPTASGYHLICATGCGWTDLSFECGVLRCAAVVDDQGVTVGLGSAPHSGARFAFEFHTKAHGWDFVALSGTEWTDLAWSCPSDCPAVVNESGVHGVGVE